MSDRILTVHKDGKPIYDIVYSTNPCDLARLLSERGFDGRRCAIVTDSNVFPLYAEQIAQQIDPKPLIYAIPAGEENKNLAQIQEIYRFLIENHYDRKSYLIALGGGVVGDMTGYVAATYLRGVDFIQIPTTLLSQADSSIGGKTGVDFEGYKNMVGAFYMPKMVFANVAFLQSLDDRQFSGGFAEVMKHGLIRDAKYYQWLIDYRDAIMARDPQVLSDMLYVSNEIKKDVVERDPYEKRERMLLNFGHTIGHAVEKYMNFEMTHGECVALGCVAATYMSLQRGLLDETTYRSIRDAFLPFGLPVSVDIPDHEAQGIVLDGISPDHEAQAVAPDRISNTGMDGDDASLEILRLTKSDKKVANGRTRFILLRSIGDAFVDETVSDEEILAGIRIITQ